MRWPERPEAASLSWASGASAPLNPQPLPPVNGERALRLGTYRPIWASPEVEISPALKFTVAHQQLELSPEDARRLGIRNGDQLAVSQNGTRLSARAAVRSGVPEGTAFLAEGIAADSANALTEPAIEVSKA